MNEQTLKLLDDPENFVREIAQAVVAEQHPAAPDAAGFMSVKSASRFLDVPEGTIRKWLQRGHVRRYKVRGCVRVRVDELIKQE
jgi:excisionase family DNA binding protein